MPQLLSPNSLSFREVSPDQLTIDTPEQVAIRFPLAGLGSRFLAILADSVVQGVAYAILILVFVLIATSAPKTTGGALSHAGEKWLVAGLILFHFLMYWGYFTLFETFWNGQTPGKKLLKIRVIQQSGRQITFFEAMTRNLLRIVDMFPGFYLVGVITMLSNHQHQRLGDLAAGTLVVHERPSDGPFSSGNTSRSITAAAFEPPTPEPFLHNTDEAALPADAVARLTADDLALIDRFFSRILDMELDTRARIAERLAAQMSQKMNLPLSADTKPESFLESIARQMRSHGR
jgi:uncharacterized RDD family membrane protein YckC